MMDLLREETQVQNYNARTEAEKHNARISENYNRLKNAIATQFAEDVRTEEQNANDGYANVDTRQKSTYISPNDGNSSTYAQVPTVTEYTSRNASALFTTERFERVQLPEEQAVSAPAAMVAPVQTTAVRMEAQYTLSFLAKVAIVAFAAVIVVMLTMICANTYAIYEKRANIARLEARKAELMEQNELVQQRIEDATSEETIREYAESQGMVKAEN